MSGRNVDRVCTADAAVATARVAQGSTAVRTPHRAQLVRRWTELLAVHAVVERLLTVTQPHTITFRVCPQRGELRFIEAGERDICQPRAAGPHLGRRLGAPHEALGEEILHGTPEHPLAVPLAVTH